MTINNAYVKNSDCYKTNAEIAPKGIMVHSTATPGVMAAAFIKRWNKPGVTVCPHVVIDNTGIYQLLPFTHRAWHCGRSGNDTHLSFEICEPQAKYNSSGTAFTSYDVQANQAYFDKAYGLSVALCAYLCDLYNLLESTIISHAEGYQLGIASNHADVGHWFPKHNKTMDDFRAAVKAYRAAVANANAQPTPTKYAVEIPGQTYNFKSMAEAQKLADALAAISVTGIAEPKYK